MAAVSCPLCTQKVKLNLINNHIDSNCVSYVYGSPKKSNLTQYFGAKANKSRKRKREQIEDEDDDCKTKKTPKKRIKTSKDEDNKNVKYEAFECKSQPSIALDVVDKKEFSDFNNFHFDQKIVGQKFCANKTYDTDKYELHRKSELSDCVYLDLLHESDNVADENAIAVVKCMLDGSVHALGYLSRTISKIMVEVLKLDNLDIFVYATPSKQDGEIQSIRILISMSSELQKDDSIVSQLNNLREIIIANKERNDLYLDILSDVLRSGHRKYSHLFETIELELLKKMIDLAGDDRTKDSIKLLSRLMLRESKWFRIESLSYDEIENTKV